MRTCRICDSPLAIFLDFGSMPRGNGFLSQKEFTDEFRFNLAAAFCANCTAVQLIEQPTAESMFHETYPFFTGSSARMKTHYENLSKEIIKRLNGNPGAFILEIGSNDGTLLANFSKSGYRHIGLEPVAAAAAKARRAGVITEELFFNKNTAAYILKKHGPVDVLIGTNVFCHIDSIRSAAEGIKKLLKPDGFAIFEDPYLSDMLEKTAYDQIYDEHVFIFSLGALKFLFDPFGLEIIHAERIPTHGGSLRYWVASRGAHSVSPSVEALLLEEKSLGIQKLETYENFRDRVKNTSQEMKKLLLYLKKQGFRVTGYGATSKSTTILNFSGIGADLIEFISDTTEFKQGKFSPGAHIPIVPPDKFSSAYPQFSVLFAWNHAEEIMEKEQAFLKNGGRWILPVPRLEIKP